jgi:hypothetical protein
MADCRGFFENHFSNLVGVHRHPSVLAEEDFGATVLSLRCVVGGEAEALVAELRLCDSQTVHMPRRQAN